MSMNGFRVHVWALAASLLLLGGCRGQETGERPIEAGRSPASLPVLDGGAPALPAGDAADPAAAEGQAGPAGPDESPDRAGGSAVPGSAATSGVGSPPRQGGEAAPLPLDTPADAAAVLRAAERVYDGIRSMEADFAQQVHVPLVGQTTRSQGKLYHRRPDRFLMQFSDPQGDLVLADGRHLWMYYPSIDARQVMRTSMAGAGQQVDLHREFLSNPTERYNAVLQGVENVGGRPAHVLVLTPRTRSGYRQVRLWIDREDSLVRRFEITEENESVRTLELRNIRRNPTLPDQLFQFTPPAGAQIFEQ